MFKVYLYYMPVFMVGYLMEQLRTLIICLVTTRDLLYYGTLFVVFGRVFIGSFDVCIDIS